MELYGCIKRHMVFMVIFDIKNNKILTVLLGGGGGEVKEERLPPLVCLSELRG